MSTSPLIGPIWSLSVEWWIYIGAPFFEKSLIKYVLILASIIFFIKSGKDWQCFIFGKSICGLAWIWLTGFAYYINKKVSFHH